VAGAVRIQPIFDLRFLKKSEINIDCYFLIQIKCFLQLKKEKETLENSFEMLMHIETTLDFIFFYRIICQTQWGWGIGITFFCETFIRNCYF